MREAQFAGVEGEALGGIRLRAVGNVADDGVAHVGEVDADLMAAACFDFQFDERAIGKALEHFEMGDGLAGVVAGRDAADAKREGLIHMAAQCAGVAFDDAFGNSEVFFLKAMPVLLQHAFEWLGFGEDDEPGGVAVKAVDDPHAVARVLRADVIGERGVGSAPFAGIERDAEPARAFIEDDDGVVFIDDFQSFGQRRGGFALGAVDFDLDLVTGAQFVIVTGDGFAVDAYAAELEPLFDAGALCLRPVREEEWQQRGGFSDRVPRCHGLHSHEKIRLAKEKRHGTFRWLPRALMSLLPRILLITAAAAAMASAADFKKDIQPILEKNCYECHSEKTGKKKGGFVFDDLNTFKLDIADNDVAQIRPGKPDESHFLEVIVNEGHERHMPPKKMLSSSDIRKITDWIKEGAAFDKNAPKLAEASAPAKKSLPPIMSWTNAEGKTIKAGFVRLEGANVVLRLPANMSEVPYPLEKLSPESRKQAQECAAP